MWKFSVILVLTVLGGYARGEEETQTKNGPSEPSLYDLALCYVADSPLSCVKEQAGRALDSWETQVEEKRHDLMVEADEEIKENNKARGLKDDETKENPSDIITAIDRGFTAIGQEYRSMRYGRDSRAMKKGYNDDTNDFNDDFTLLDGLSRVEAEGNVAESREENEEKGLNLSRQDDFYGVSSGSGKGKGKKGKKGKKGMMKIFFIGALIKAKVEMLLKILSFHLQLKFFAIALASLVINLARFWVDLKKQPQKVVYHEHSSHQHHYDEHDDWGSSWKRQAHNQPQQEYSTDFAHRLAYHNNNNNGYPQHSY